jgi:hypothetical protein
MDKIKTLITEGRPIDNDLYNVYENVKYVYQMVFVSYIHSDNEHLYESNIYAKTKESNYIANYLCDYTHDIYHNVIITKTLIHDDNTVSRVDMTQRDFFEIFRKKKQISGVLITPDNEIKELDYIGNPLNCFNPEERLYMGFHEADILDKIFMFYIEAKPAEGNDRLNKIATSLYRSKNNINGNVYVTIKRKPFNLNYDRYQFLDITKEHIQKLYELSCDTDFVYNQHETNYNSMTQKYQNFYGFIDELYYNYILKRTKNILINKETEEELLNINDNYKNIMKDETNSEPELPNDMTLNEILRQKLNII